MPAEGFSSPVSYSLRGELRGDGERKPTWQDVSRWVNRIGCEFIGLAFLHFEILNIINTFS